MKPLPSEGAVRKHSDSSSCGATSFMVCGPWSSPSVCSFPWAAGMLTTRPRAARGGLLLGAVGSSLLHVLSRLPEGAVTLTFLGLQTRRYPSSLSPRAALSVCLGARLTLVCLTNTPASGLRSHPGPVCVHPNYTCKRSSSKKGHIHRRQKLQLEHSRDRTEPIIPDDQPPRECFKRT